MNGWERAGSTTWRPSASEDGWKKIRREVKDDVLVLEQWNNMPSSLDSPSSKCALSKVLTARANERPGIWYDEEVWHLSTGCIIRWYFESKVVQQTCTVIGRSFLSSSRSVVVLFTIFFKSKPLKTLPIVIHTVIGQSFPMSSNSAPYKRSFNTYLCNSTYVYYWKHDIQRMRDQEFDVNSDPC